LAVSKQGFGLHEDRAQNIIYANTYQLTQKYGLGTNSELFSS